MPNTTWQELVYNSTADETPVANTVSESVIFPVYTFAPNYLSNGRSIHVRARGKLSTAGTPTIKFGVRLGGVGGVLLAETEAITNGSGVTNVNWSLDVTIQVRTNGATGTVLAFGVLLLHTAAGTVAINVFSISGYDAPAVATVNLTIEQDLAVTCTWGTASASNTLTTMMAQIIEQN